MYLHYLLHECNQPLSELVALMEGSKNWRTFVFASIEVKLEALAKQAKK